MEIKFNQTLCRHLQAAVDQVQTQEQTQEIRLPDSMPDIGRVLGAWGKVLVRGKEWRTDAMGVSGGVMAWVLYVPEDGSEPRSVETWIPFQLKWDIPQTRADGFVCVRPWLKGIDARGTSARKIMVRANIGAHGQGLETVETAVFTPGEMPEDVELLTNIYPMELPMEAGEKLFQLDDDVELSTVSPRVEKLLRYDLMPVITEKKMMASRLVFRGKALIHGLYLADGAVYSFDTELPFSQFADLEREYGQNASAQMFPMVNNLDMDLVENRLQVKCGLGAQYVTFDRQMMALTEDAYSPVRSVQLQKNPLEISARLDESSQIIQVGEAVNAEAGRIVEAGCSFDAPQRRQEGDMAQILVPGVVQVVYYDPAGNLQWAGSRFEKTVPLLADGDATVDCWLVPDGMAQAKETGQQIEVTAAALLTASTFAGQAQQMVTGLELGEIQEDVMKPSLILRRFTDTSLWEMAKESSSTVDAIRQANGLTEEPEKGRMLLIPVC